MYISKRFKIEFPIQDEERDGRETEVGNERTREATNRNATNI